MNTLFLAAATYLTLAVARNVESKICRELSGSTAVECKCDADTQDLELLGHEYNFQNITTLTFENCASVSTMPGTLLGTKELKQLKFTNIKNLSLDLTLPTTLENLTITNTNINELSADSFVALWNIKSFQIKDSSVVKIKPRTFSSSVFTHVEFRNVTFQNLSQNALELTGAKVVIEYCTFLSPEVGSIQIDSEETIISFNKFYNLNNRTLEISTKQCRPNKFPSEKRDNCNHFTENANICEKGKYCSSSYSGFNNVCQVNSSNICEYKKSTFLKTFGIKPSTCSETQKESPTCELYIISAANILSFHAVACLLAFVIYIFNL